MRAIENVIRAVLREAGIKLGTPSRKAFADRVRELVDDDPSVMPLVAPLLSILAAMSEQLAHLTGRVQDTARSDDVCRRLMSTPGVGPITAFAFRSTIDHPNRFKRSRDVGAHLGPTPARYPACSRIAAKVGPVMPDLRSCAPADRDIQSGEADIQGRVSRCGDELARPALYEAAHSLLVRSRKRSPH